MGKLDKIFDSIENGGLFKNKYVLQTNHTPENIPHRDKQIEQVGAILAPILRGERTSNLFVYGQTGTGKTLSVQYVRDELIKRYKSEGSKLKIIYINCKLKKVSDTEYRILAEIIKQLGSSVPATGLPTDQVYNKFIEILEGEKLNLMIILDEIDQAVKKISDNFLYNLTRLNSELSKTQISLVGISNDLKFLDSLDPRVRSSLGEEEIVFSPYNALQLQDILKKRAEEAFCEGVLTDGVISKCAAFAAREHGDARRALDLLRISAELAERDGSKKILLKHIDLANSKIDKDKIYDIIESAPRQFQLVFKSIIDLNSKSKSQKNLDGKPLDKIYTGDVFNVYESLCEKTKTEILTQRRVGDLIAEMDMLGLINATVISKGRHGRTREIKLVIPDNILEKVEGILGESLMF
ncbi:MAG: orc1/cdc6 family replication initiation protein [Nanoarchaeota archaeon]|nr:orc1/cdc6 family replication initiation protein [Nanoarchaeota archaeon]